MNPNTLRKIDGRNLHQIMAERVVRRRHVIESPLRFGEGLPPLRILNVDGRQRRQDEDAAVVSVEFSRTPHVGALDPRKRQIAKRIGNASVKYRNRSSVLHLLI